LCEYDSAKTAEKAAQDLHGTVFNGRSLRVALATARKPDGKDG